MHPHGSTLKNQIVEFKGTAKKWIIMWSFGASDIIYGHMLTAVHFTNFQPFMFIEHWVFSPTPSQPQQPTTPRSMSTILHPYQECNLHSSYFMGSMQPKCTIRLSFAQTILI